MNDDAMPVQVSPSLAKLIRDGQAHPPLPFPMVLLRPHEAQARLNHSQSLDRLRERGGLDACELLAILEGRPWPHDADAEKEMEAFVRLAEILAKAAAA